MLSITSTQLNIWLISFFWPFFRILALIAASPVLGARGVPASAKISLSFALAVIISPILPPLPNVAPASATGVFILAQQLMIGLAMGLSVRIIFSAVEMAGYIMGLQMGLGFATLFDPQNSTQVPVISQFLGLVATLIFLAMNGHLLMISGLVESFEILPIGLHPLANEGWRTLVIWGGEIFRTGVLISLPVVAALLVTNVALGILTRAAPQLNIFAVGFPLTLGVGFMVIALSFAHFIPVFSHLVEDSVQVMLKIAQGANRLATF